MSNMKKPKVHHLTLAISLIITGLIFYFFIPHNDSFGYTFLLLTPTAIGSIYLSRLMNYDINKCLFILMIFGGLLLILMFDLLCIIKFLDHSEKAVLWLFVSLILASVFLWLFLIFIYRVIQFFKKVSKNNEKRIRCIVYCIGFAASSVTVIDFLLQRFK